MSYLIKNILDPYREDKNQPYLIKNFTNTKILGIYSPHSKDAICSNPDGMEYVGTVDEQNTYDINHLGFRGHIDENSDTLASGCSLTFGIGIPESARWTNLLSKTMNKDIINLGSPGSSIESICINIIQYCMNNKMPKEIFCLFPDFFRSTVVVDKNFYKTKTNSNPSRDYLSVTYCNPSLNYDKGSVSMSIEDPTYIEDSVSPHQLILKSVNYIYILESFCKSNNIKLHWTTWDLKTDTAIREISKIEDFKLKNFTSFYPYKPKVGANVFVFQTCKLSHESEFKDNSTWDVGSDYSVINYKKQYNTAHPGIHLQYHFSDFFYKLHNQDIINS